MPSTPALVPASPVADTGSAALRDLLSPAAASRPLTLWGSSSMSSHRGEDDSPLPVRIHERLALACGDGVVHPFGVAATRSGHTMLTRGLETPHATLLTTPATGTGAVLFDLDGGLSPVGPLVFPARLGTVTGLVDDADGAWRFTPEDPSARLADGTLTSTLTDGLDDARQILWTGKNNIREVEQVLADVQRLWESTPTPATDSLVLGQWPTERDPVGSDTGEALATVNAEQADRYGERFLDLQALLTSEDGLASADSVAPLQLLEQASTHEALAQGVTPPLLVAADGTHLNGWGNLAVSCAIVERMGALRWL